MNPQFLFFQIWFWLKITQLYPGALTVFHLFSFCIPSEDKQDFLTFSVILQTFAHLSLNLYLKN